MNIFGTGSDIFLRGHNLLLRMSNPDLLLEEVRGKGLILKEVRGKGYL